MSKQDDGQTMSFWDHLDVLRKSVFRVCLVALGAGCLCFACKDILFSIILAPASSDFYLYRWMNAEPFHINLINTELTEQFMIHMKVAFMAGLFIASPYILYVMFRFISPALYESERRNTIRIVGSAYLLFILGVVIDYLTIFPLTVNFLATYQISEDVQNMLSISSYIDTMLMMSMMFGILFEMPILSWLLGRFGLLKSRWMKRYRRHAFVAILIIAAIITPTGDPFTLAIVSFPMWLLFEAGIFIVSKVEKQPEVTPTAPEPDETEPNNASTQSGATPDDAAPQSRAEFSDADTQNGTESGTAPQQSPDSEDDRIANENGIF